MIMYAGKQFGNNLRNGDDAVFGDSNRPRDEDGFKLRPGLQSDKWTFRDVNKKTGFSQLVLKGYTDCTSSTPGKPAIWEVPIIKRKWTKEARTSTGYPSVFRSDASYEVGAYDNEFWNNPQYKIVEGNFNYYSSDGNNATIKNKDTACIEFVEDGLYYIEITSQYYFSYNNTGNYNSNNAYLYKERVGLMSYDRDNNCFLPTNTRCQRAVGNGDAVSLGSIFRFGEGQRILPCGALYQPTGSNGMYILIAVTKLG